MTYPRSSARMYRILTWVILFCAATACVLFLARKELVPFFLTRASVNTAILVLGLAGLVLSFVEIVRLTGQAVRLDDLADALESGRAATRTTIHDLVEREPSGLVAERCRRIVGLTGRRSANLSEALSILSEADAESEEGREVFVRYLLGVMVFLGLMGTFWGVLLTVGGVQQIFASLDPAKFDDPLAFVAQMRSSMGSLLGGLSTAFSTSLFGIGGSVILGFVDAQARSARSSVLADLDRFVVTSFLPAVAPEAEAVVAATPVTAQPASPPGGELYLPAVLEALGENLRRLTDVIAMQASTEEKVSESLVEMKGMLENLREETGKAGEGVQMAHQMRQGLLERVDNLGRHMERLVKEMRLQRDTSEENGKALLDRLKLEGEITNKTLSIGFSDVIRTLGKPQDSPAGKGDSRKEDK
jgi:hypothetical protein